jgi:hypothetical protein
MNALAISNHLIMRLLQCQNTKRVIAKKMNIFENKKGNNNEQNNEYTSISIPPSILTLPQLQPNDELKTPILATAAATSEPEPVPEHVPL